MDQRHRGKLAIQRLSAAERDTLEGLVLGESVRALSQRRSIGVTQALEIRESLKRKLGVRSDARAVRIGLVAADRGSSAFVKPHNDER